MGKGRKIKPRPFHRGTNRPVWKGPIPDKYYYVVKNKPKTPASWIVLHTDNPKYEPYIRQIAAVQGGYWSLIESDVPLPRGPNCKLRRRGEVEEIKDKLNRSHDRASKIRNEAGERFPISGVPVSEEEVFG